ncbi:hypothetical protein ZHAS_00021503 [Anopheles sinensis]|uniref:Uncharacterized protein n=1 Tax=Anopheles sinensis TaxID=74873 RepID=A0A084WSK4_ANOSI|nr:hypothetical protein ZHAS_00021503 [Anopheles sinensis]
MTRLETVSCRTPTSQADGNLVQRAPCPCSVTSPAPTRSFNLEQAASNVVAIGRGISRGVAWGPVCLASCWRNGSMRKRENSCPRCRSMNARRTSRLEGCRQRERNTSLGEEEDGNVRRRRWHSNGGESEPLQVQPGVQVGGILKRTRSAWVFHLEMGKAS